MDTDIDKGAEIGDVGHDARQFHTLVQVFYALHAAVKLEGLYLFTWVTTGLLQLLHDVREGGESHFCCHIVLDVNPLARILITY